MLPIRREIPEPGRAMVSKLSQRPLLELACVLDLRSQYPNWPTCNPCSSHQAFWLRPLVRKSWIRSFHSSCFCVLDKKPTPLRWWLHYLIANKKLVGVLALTLTPNWPTCNPCSSHQAFWLRPLVRKSWIRSFHSSCFCVLDKKPTPLRWWLHYLIANKKLVGVLALTLTLYRGPYDNYPDTGG